MSTVEPSQVFPDPGSTLPLMDLHLRALAVEAADNGIIITDLQGVIQWANPAFTRMTGYSLEEVLGRNLRLLKSGQHDDEYYHDMWEVILSGQVSAWRNYQPAQRWRPVHRRADHHPTCG